MIRELYAALFQAQVAFLMRLCLLEKRNRGIGMLSAIAGAVTIWFVLATVLAFGIAALMQAQKATEREMARQTQRSLEREAWD
jgi:hypothetical protein